MYCHISNDVTDFFGKGPGKGGGGGEEGKEFLLDFLVGLREERGERGEEKKGGFSYYRSNDNKNYDHKNHRKKQQSLNRVA